MPPGDFATAGKAFASLRPIRLTSHFHDAVRGEQLVGVHFRGWSFMDDIRSSVGVTTSVVGMHGLHAD